MRLKFAGCHIVQFLSDDLASPPHFPCGLWAHAKKEPRCSTSKTYTASPSGGSLGMFQTQQIAEESPWEPKSKGLGWLGIRDKKFANLGFVVGLTLWTWDWIFQRLNFGAQAGLEWATLNRSESGRKLSDSMARHRKNCSDVDLDVEFWFLFHTYIHIYIFHSSSDFWISNCAWWFLEACLKHVARFGRTGLARSTLQVAFPDTSQWPLDLPELPIVSYLQ